MYGTFNLYLTYSFQFTVQASRMRPEIFNENYLYFYTKKDIIGDNFANVEKMIKKLCIVPR